jgi:hypothetical protein
MKVRDRRVSFALALLTTALLLSVPVAATATTLAIGVVTYDTFIPGPGGTNAFFVSNLTGGFALPPDFPVATELVLQSPLMQWSGVAGSPFDFGGVGIGAGSHDPDLQLQFPDTDLFASAKFTATIDHSTFQLADGRFFAAVSTTVEAVLIDPTGLLAPGDFAVLTVDANEIRPQAVPEPGTLTLVVTALAAFGARARREHIAKHLARPSAPAR